MDVGVILLLLLVTILFFITGASYWNSDRGLALAFLSAGILSGALLVGGFFGLIGG